MAGLADFVTGFQRGRQMKYYREDREEARRARDEGRQASTLAADILFPGAGGSAAPQQTRVPLSALATPSPLPMGQNRNMIDAPTSSQFGPVQFGIGPQAPISRLSGSAGQPVPAQGGVAPAGQPAPAGGAAMPGAGGVDPRLPQLARMGPQGLQTALAIQERQRAQTLEQRQEARDRIGRYLGALNEVGDDPAQQEFWWNKVKEGARALGQEIPPQLEQFSPQGYNMAVKLWGDYDKSLEREAKEASAEKTKLEADKLRREAISNPDNFKSEKDARQEFQNITKDFRTVRDAATRIEASAKDPSAAGDLALIFNYMKVLDPGSTVREGEFATAQNSAGLPERLRAMYNSIINGERLAPAQRTDFLARSRKLFKAQQGQYAETEKQFRALATRYGLDPNNVVLDYNPVEAVPEGNAPQPGAVEDGYRFKGGDPSDQNNWEPVQ